MATPQLPEVSFRAAFEGPAVDAGRMNAKDLAPSLFATAELVERSAATIYGVDNAVTVQVKADFRRGSFNFELIAAVVAIAGQQILQNLSVSDLDTLLRYIGLKVGEENSLFGVLRKVGRGKIERIEPRPDGSTSIIVNGPNAIITINNVKREVSALVTNEGVRESLPAIVAPVARPGIDAYRIGDLPGSSTLVTKEDLPAFQPSPISVELADDTAVTALELLAPNFVEGNKWRVAQGGEPFWVKIADLEFLESIEQGERGFFKGDYLIVELRTKAYATPDGLQVDREVIKVREHKTRTRQLPLI